MAGLAVGIGFPWQSSDWVPPYRAGSICCYLFPGPVVTLDMPVAARSLHGQSASDAWVEHNKFDLQKNRSYLYTLVLTSVWCTCLGITSIVVFVTSFIHGLGLLHPAAVGQLEAQ